MKRFFKDALVGLIAFIAQVTGIISVFATAAYFWKGVDDALDILIFSGPIFVIFFLITCRIKGGLTWLLVWMLPLP